MVRNQTPGRERVVGAPGWSARCSLGVLAILVGTATAQARSPMTALPPTAGAPNAPPVDQGVTDRGALSTSLRSLSIDLAVPTGFQQLYELPGGGFYRMQGAIVATFPESRYVARDGRELPTFPAGMVFHIGPPPELRQPAAGPRHPIAERERLAHVDDARLAAHLDARFDLAISESIEDDPGQRVDRPRRRPPAPPRDGLGLSDAPLPDAMPFDGDARPRFLDDEQYRRERLRAMRALMADDRP